MFGLLSFDFVYPSMEYFSYLFLIDILITISYCIPNNQNHNTDLAEVFRYLDLENYLFTEYSLHFVFLFGIIPVGVICMILVSFKIYTHDFVKPIQRSYVMASFFYISSILLNMYLTDFLISFSYNISFTRIEFDANFYFVYRMFNRLVTLIINVIFFTIIFLFLEIQIAFRLNSIPLKNFYILKRNNTCLSSILFVSIAYVTLLFRFLRPIYKYLKSMSRTLVLLNNSIISVSCSCILFYFMYLNYTNNYIFANSRIYREF